MEMVKNNLVDAYNELIAAGYTEEFRLHQTHLHAITQDVKLEVNDFDVDAAFRFEGSISEDDTSDLYAISAPKFGIKGLLVDVVAQFGKLPDHPLSEKLLAADLNTKSYDTSGEEEKYALPKVYKAKFVEDPERYELRKGFPDFPGCPYGNSFSMLGYDKELKRYVWLVNSIMRDERLQVREYAS